MVNTSGWALSVSPGNLDFSSAIMSFNSREATPWYNSIPREKETAVSAIRQQNLLCFWQLQWRSVDLFLCAM